MKTSLDHLPSDKQQQLLAITEIFRAADPVHMLILFGSHARGDWVEDRQTGYKSDWDLLVIVENEKHVAEVLLWGELEKRTRELIGGLPLTLIVHDIRFINREIRLGQYFWGDIANEGILLYDSRCFTLAKPKALNPQERLALAERNFASWFDSASEFWRGCRYYAARNLLKHAAFLLHQATERFYHTALLVFTGYKQRTHDIELLGDLAGAQHPLLADVLPKTEPEDKRLFDLLKKAYIDARYSMSYHITPQELTTLQARVLELAQRVRTACLEKMATFCGAEAMRRELPVPPALTEPLLQNLPPPPTEPAQFQQWAQSLAELSEQRGEEKGRHEGQRIGEEKGRQEGQRIGEQTGEMRRGAADILMVLRTRGLPVPPEVERHIASCTDSAELSRWLQRAVTATTAAEVIAV